MANCTVCGSRFADRQCYFCESKVCTSCIVPPDVSGSYSTTKCINCDRRKVRKISFLNVIKRNKFIIGMLVALWIFTIFPIPFLQFAGIDIDPSAFQPVLIATAIMAVPFIFMFIAWQKKAPASGTR